MGLETFKEWHIRFRLVPCSLLHFHDVYDYKLKLLCLLNQRQYLIIFLWLLKQDRFKNWESSGVKIIPVLSQSDDKWTGECGYVQVGSTYFHACSSLKQPSPEATFSFLKLLLFQAAFARAKKLYSPQATGAVLCGQKQMSEVCHFLQIFTFYAIKDLPLFLDFLFFLFKILL